MTDDNTKHDYSVGDKLIATYEFCARKVHSGDWTQDVADKALEQEGVIDFVSPHAVSVRGDGWAGHVTDFVTARRMREAWVAKNGGAE